jgi:hypothetical protein
MVGVDLRANFFFLKKELTNFFFFLVLYIYSLYFLLRMTRVFILLAFTCHLT